MDDMKLFTLGPVEMEPQTLEISGAQTPYFRTQPFSETVLACKRAMLRTANAPQDSDMVFLTASGSGAMEAAVMNCFDHRDKLLIIDGGGFGRRFTEICSCHSIPWASVQLPFGTALTREMLAAEAGKGFTGLLVNIHETTTGQLYNMEMISAFCRSEGLILMADAISSFLADETDMAGWSVDALIVSSHKALALAPGMSFILLSPRMMGERIDRIRCANLYFDFKDYLKNGIRGQTPFTPAVGVISALRGRLERIETLGVRTVVRQTAAQAADFRGRITGLPVRLPQYSLSNACTPLIFDTGGAGQIFERLAAEHGIYVNPNGGALSDTVLRVGHLGNLDISDNAVLAAALEAVLCKQKPVL